MAQKNTTNVNAASRAQRAPARRPMVRPKSVSGEGKGVQRSGAAIEQQLQAAAKKMPNRG